MDQFISSVTCLYSKHVAFIIMDMCLRHISLETIVQTSHRWYRNNNGIYVLMLHSEGILFPVRVKLDVNIFQDR